MDFVLITIGLQSKLNVNMNMNFDLTWIWNEIWIEHGLVWISIGVWIYIELGNIWIGFKLFVWNELDLNWDQWIIQCPLLSQP
jgi:hypothetical protein